MRFQDIIITILAAFIVGAGLDSVGVGPLLGIPAQVGAMLYVLNRLDVRRMRKEYEAAQEAYDALFNPEAEAQRINETYAMGTQPPDITTAPPNPFFPDDYDAVDPDISARVAEKDIDIPPTNPTVAVDVTPEGHDAGGAILTLDPALTIGKDIAIPDEGYAE